MPSASLYHLRTILTCAVLFLLTGAAHAAPDSRLPGVIDRPVPTLPPLQEQAPPAALPTQPPQQESADTRPITTLSQVRFRGVSVLDAALLQAIARPYLQHPVSADDLAQLKHEVTQAYFRRGYVLVKVTTPPQDLSSGDLEVVIHEARIGALDLDTQDLLRPAVAAALAQRVTPGSVFHEGNAESLVSDFTDLAGVRAALTLRKGQALGTTDLLLRLTPAEEDIQQLSLDNYGSELTGDWVAGLRVQKSNTLRLGEQLQLSLRASDGALWSATMAARLPSGWRNVMLNLEYSYSENEIGDRLSALDASGRSSRARIGFTTKLLNTRVRTAGLGAGFDLRRHESFLADHLESQDRLRQLYIEGNYLRRASQGLVYGELRVIKGGAYLDASAQGDSEASRVGGDPLAWRVQPLFYGNARLGDQSTLSATLSGQLASNTVLSSDLFALGGYGSVRGFEPAEATGEAGVQGSLEYNHLLVNSDQMRWTGAVFADGGRVWNRVAHATVENALYSVGVGVELNAQRWSRGATTLRADLAVPVGDYTAATVDDYRAYLRVQHAF